MKAPLCYYCEKRPAACRGAYEGSTIQRVACDECCGHGNEDGHCEPIVPTRTKKPACLKGLRYGVTVTADNPAGHELRADFKRIAILTHTNYADAEDVGRWLVAMEGRIVRMNAALASLCDCEGRGGMYPKLASCRACRAREDK